MFVENNRCTICDNFIDYNFCVNCGNDLREPSKKLYFPFVLLIIFLFIDATLRIMSWTTISGLLFDINPGVAVYLLWLYLYVAGYLFLKYGKQKRRFISATKRSTIRVT